MKDVIIRELFNALTAAAVFFVVLEFVWAGSVSAYINLNWILILWVIFGIVLLFKSHKA